MSKMRYWPYLAALIVAIGCGSGQPEEAAASPEASERASASATAPAPIVLAQATEATAPSAGSGLSGTVTLSIEGDHYSSSYNLKTTFPGRDDELMADVIGTGSGSVDGGSLTGTSQTQLVIASVPGVDPSFAFIPRVVGLRLTSTPLAVFEADGSVTMASQNQPGDGQDYIPTRTTLRGERIAEDAVADR